MKFNEHQLKVTVEHVPEDVLRMKKLAGVIDEISKTFAELSNRINEAASIIEGFDAEASGDDE